MQIMILKDDEVLIFLPFGVNSMVPEQTTDSKEKTTHKFYCVSLNTHGDLTHWCSQLRNIFGTDYILASALDSFTYNFN